MFKASSSISKLEPTNTENIQEEKESADKNDLKASTKTLSPDQSNKNHSSVSQGDKSSPQSDSSQESLSLCESNQSTITSLTQLLKN